MSISSSEGSPAPPDLAVKYHKLASEYAKARSQITVLKQAIRDEKTRSVNQNDMIKAKEQELRKDSQELESLAFRNQQLTKRVTVLQDELDKFHSNAKRGRSLPEHNRLVDESKLFQEELQNRILQNASLLQKLEEKDLQLESDRVHSKNAIELLEKSLSEVRRNCECDSLRSTVAALKLAANDKQLSPSSIDWKVEFLKGSPLVDLLNKTISVIDAEKGNSLPLIQIREAISSKEYFPSAVRRGVTNLTDCGTSCTNSNSSVLDLLNHIRNVLIEISSVCDAEADKMQEGLSSLIQVIDAMSNSVLCQLKVSNNDPVIRAALVGLNECCAIYKGVVLVLQTGVTDESSQTNISSCQRCPQLEERYKQEIKLLERKLTDKSYSSFKAEQGSNVTANGDTFKYHHEQHNNLDPMTTPINDFFVKRSNAILEQIQYAESKLTRVQNECDAIQCRYEQAMDELIIKSDRISLLEEELTVTTRNYEDQLGSMSEHMANMNDKLAAQETMIEELTYQLQSKVSSLKGRGK